MNKINVLYEDNHLIAINKTGGMLTHSDRTGDQTALELTKQYIKHKYSKPGAVFLQPVHRIDRPTSGILLFARTSKATNRMTNLFKAKQVKKIYYAISDHYPNYPQDKVLTNWLIKNEKRNTVQTTSSTNKQAKEASLSFSIIQEQNGQYLFKITPYTGRSHQIRVQLSQIGSPILGDFKYGSIVKTDHKSIALHAQFISFIHPVQKELLEISCPLPDKPWWINFSTNKKSSTR